MFPEPAHVADDPAPTTPERPRRRPGRQLKVRTTLVIVAVAAIAFSIIKDRRQIAWLQERISAIQPMVRELQIDDPPQVAVVRLEEMWMGEEKWDIHLPPGTRHRLRIATREIVLNAKSTTGTDSMPTASHEAIFEPGRHLIELERKQDEAKVWHMTVISDGRPVIQAIEATDWETSWETSGGSVGGGHYPISQQIPPDQVVDLYRMRFRPPEPSSINKSVETTPGNGLALWIDREPAIKFAP